MTFLSSNPILAEIAAQLKRIADHMERDSPVTVSSPLLVRTEKRGRKSMSPKEGDNPSAVGADRRSRIEAAQMGTTFAAIGFLAAIAEFGNQMVGLWCPLSTGACLAFCIYRLGRAVRPIGPTAADSKENS